MKPLNGVLAWLLIVAVIPACTGKEETTSGEQKGTGAARTQEEVLLEKTITDLASRGTEFPKTKDSQSILRFYSRGYAGINNGKSESLKDIEKYLSDLIERINRGEPIGVSAKVSNIKTSVTGPSGWATYDYDYKVGRGGVVLQAEQGKCTTIFRKQGDSWLIQHDHCSTESPPIFLR
ncbi:MAG TPA: nuclear transport factor 2 family protein [Nitrospiraceae bacterium]|nr:nuclear transport factor 2 family protein [Nitrospiraceae bacterium]